MDARAFGGWKAQMGEELARRDLGTIHYACATTYRERPASVPQPLPRRAVAMKNIRPATTKPALECTSPDSRATTELYRRLIAEFVDDIQSPLDTSTTTSPSPARHPFYHASRPAFVGFCGANTVNALASVGSTAARGGMYTSGLQGCADCSASPTRILFVHCGSPLRTWFPAPTSGHQHSHPLCHPALAPAPVIALAPHGALPHPAIPYSRGPHSQPAPARYASAPHDTRICGDLPELFGLDYSTLARNPSAIEDDKIGLSANVSTSAAVRPFRLRVVQSRILFAHGGSSVVSSAYPYAAPRTHNRICNHTRIRTHLR
ncbi:hypothetical protein B0H12DRAFT_1229056 [Mycena haematopus]|nr:hypothetical protein B0H12DRAFT_1229056 [Mycena haematopus]